MTQLVAGSKGAPIAQHSSVASNATGLTEEQMLDTIQNILYPGSKRESALMILDYCKASKIDPMAKSLHIVPMSVKNKDGKYEFRDTIMPGIGFYRLKAVATGQWGGIDEPVFGPAITKNLGGVNITFPEWCSITVHRMIGDNKLSASKREYWLENYATKGRDSQAPNDMWAKRPYAQLEKCCESQALRRAFPDIASIPTAEEMEGKEYFQDVTHSAPTATIDAGTGEVQEGKYTIDSMPFTGEELFGFLMQRLAGLYDKADILHYETWKQTNDVEIRRYAKAHPNDAKEIGAEYQAKKDSIFGTEN